VGQYTDIAIDSQSAVHISYSYYTSGDLKYATNRSGIWVTSTVDSAGSVGMYTAIALGTNDQVFICYQDYDAFILKCASK